MSIEYRLLPLKERRPKPSDENKLGFSLYYGDHMFTMPWTRKEGWGEACICGMEDFHISPAAFVLHYAQSVFEGLKAYRTHGGGVNLFRPRENMKRLNRSARRLTLPEVDEAFLLKGIEKLLEIDQEWILSATGTSLYIRPTLVAAEPFLGLRPTNEVRLFVITSPVGSFYQTGFKPVSIMVNEKYSRASRGGLGDVKASANYSAAMLAEEEAHNSGHAQVLWLDSQEKRWVEEVGSMNIFFKIRGTVITPALGGTILPGITRDSILQLLKSWDIPHEERPIALQEVLTAQQAGTLEEVFGSGTVAVISSVKNLNYQAKDYPIAEAKDGSIAARLLKELTDIQYGRTPDPLWMGSCYTSLNPSV